MRLLLVDSSYQDLLHLAAKIEQLPQAAFQKLELEVALVRDDELWERLREKDVVILGSGLGARAFEIAEQLLQSALAIQIIVFVRATNAYAPQSAILQVLPDDSNVKLLEKILLDFAPKDTARSKEARDAVIAGRYKIEKLLGQGSYGIVYLCRHLEISDQLVAVKVLHPDLAKDPRTLEHFRNEIFASYGVSHPNIIRAWEYVRDGDVIAMTMEYAPGEDLSPMLNGKLPIERIVQILSQLCQGLSAIHDAGLMHRNLKAENILFSESGAVKIADFCMARTLENEKIFSSDASAVSATIDYVSPEYMLNGQLDWRTDIYAAGLIGYEMITGDLPFRGDSVYATMSKRLKGDFASPSTIRKECPPELASIILKAAARDPEKRFQSAHEMNVALSKLRLVLS